MLMLGPSDVLLAPPEDSVEDTDEGKDCSFANVCSARGLRSSARWVGSSVWVVKSLVLLVETFAIILSNDAAVDNTNWTRCDSTRVALQCPQCFNVSALMIRLSCPNKSFLST